MKKINLKVNILLYFPSSVGPPPPWSPSSTSSPLPSSSTSPPPASPASSVSAMVPCPLAISCHQNICCHTTDILVVARQRQENISYPTLFGAGGTATGQNVHEHNNNTRTRVLVIMFPCSVSIEDMIQPQAVISRQWSIFHGGWDDGLILIKHAK